MRPPSPPQIYQKTICLWNNFHRTFTEHWQRTPNFQKGKPISLEWGRAKDKDKTGDKGVWDGDLHPGKGVMKEEKFPQIRKLLHTGLWGDLQSFRGECSETGPLKAKWRKFATEILLNVTLQLRSSSHAHVTCSKLGQGWRFRPQGSVLGVGPELTAMKSFWEGYVTLQRQTREHPGTTWEAKDNFHGKTLTLLSNPAHSQNQEPCPSECWKGVSWLQSTALEARKQV